MKIRVGIEARKVHHESLVRLEMPVIDGSLVSYVMEEDTAHQLLADLQRVLTEGGRIPPAPWPPVQRPKTKRRWFSFLRSK
jgi:hypothetical protein